MWLPYIVGIFMGIADLIPGVSGGTIAFIMGVYERLINAIKGVGTKKGDLKFLLPLLLGIVTSILSFSHLLESFLNDVLLRTYLYAAFMGMILGSTLFCSKQIKVWSHSCMSALFIAMLFALVLTGQLSLAESLPAYSTLWILFCGAIAISAMLLPGISGSYLLTILGVYPVVLQNLNVLTGGLAKGSFEIAAIQFMVTLLVGILLGAVIFSRIVSFSLKHYHDLTISALTGFMLGGIPSVWPFWVYESVPHLLKPEKGSMLVPKEMILPDVFSQDFLFGVSFMALGFLWIMMAERIAARQKSVTTTTLS